MGRMIRGIIQEYTEAVRSRYLGVANRCAIAKNNIASLEVYNRFPTTRVYAEGRYLRILWWRFWKEKLLPPEKTTQ